VIANIEVSVGNDDPTDKGRNRRLTVERVSPMDHQAGVYSTLAGLFGIKPGIVLPSRECGTTPAGNHTGTRRRRVDVNRPGLGERCHEGNDPLLIAGLKDEIKGVLTLDDRLAVYLDAKLANLRATQIVEQVGPEIGVGGRAPIRVMLMAYNKQTHRWPSSSTRC
jgi:hypothetical protein